MKSQLTGIELPKAHMCIGKINRSEPNIALEKFIYKFEPTGTAERLQWRDMLANLINEVRNGEA